MCLTVKQFIFYSLALINLQHSSFNRFYVFIWPNGGAPIDICASAFLTFRLNQAVHLPQLKSNSDSKNWHLNYWAHVMLGAADSIQSLALFHLINQKWKTPYFRTIISKYRTYVELVKSLNPWQKCGCGCNWTLANVTWFPRAVDVKATKSYRVSKIECEARTQW